MVSPAPIQAPALLREACARPPLPVHPMSVADLAEFSLAQEAALNACEARADALVTLIDAYNAALAD